MELAYRFSPLPSRWEQGNIQAGMVQEELRVLCLHPKAASGRPTSRQLGWGSYTHTHSDTPIPTRSHLFQQGHTYANKATPPNGVTPWPKNIQTITFHSLAPIDLFKHMSLWGGLKYSIMQNAFSRTFKVLTVYSSLNNVLKVQSSRSLLRSI